MKYLIIALIIYVIIITNLVTFGTTFMINDYLWREYQSQIEYNLFVAVHRGCIKSIGDNTICNVAAKSIYQSYQKNWNPLPGFDWDYIIAPIGNES